MLGIFELIKSIIVSAGYISSGNKSFPKPLSPEKEAMCIKAYMNGDQSARETLIEHNLRLVAHIAKKFSNFGSDHDDFISIGTIGLIKAIDTFHTEKGKLATYISKCVENEILMFLRSSKKSSLEISLGEAIGEDQEGNQVSLFDILSSEDYPVEEQASLSIETKKLTQIMERALTPREKIIIELRYGLTNENPLPQRVIANRLGISRSYISRIEKHALEKLKKELSK